MTTLATLFKTADAGLRPRVADRAWYAYAARLLPAPPGVLGRWVDLGCGQGEFLELVQAIGSQGFGLDFNPHNARRVRGDGRPSLVADLNRPLPFRDYSLDGASLIEVIEHIVQAEDLLQELSRVIRPGGWLVVTTPNVAHLTYRWRALTGHPPKQEGYHYRFFTKKTLRQSLEQSGFRLVGRASFGKQSLATKLGRLAGRGRRYKFRYQVPAAMESLLAQHFVWRLERI
ncbi:MAG TPA: class I SAM-dependent methyltransferase [Myxococcota bacterium]|nr:class I SAM-dependent methyltransferase [Myxococcota bacterium]